MKSTILYVLMAALLASTSISCRSIQVPDSDRPWNWPSIPPPKPVESPFKEAYTERRWVGLLEKGAGHCPDVEGWVSETLLKQVLDRAKLANDKPLLGLGLERYCIYTPWNGPWVDFRPPQGLVKPKQDRLALSITSAGGVPSDMLGQKIWPVLAQHFRDQTGQETSGQEPLLLLKGKPNVRLTFIDSQPDGEESFAKPPATDSQHGFTLVRLAQDMLCPPPPPSPTSSSVPCPVKITARRALSYQNFNPQAPLPPEPVGDGRSGHVGLVSDLAAAIYAEVFSWRQHDPEKRLIINLSLGWDGEGFRDLDAHGVSELEPSVQSVYRALRFARKSGALVIAAAGNQRGGGGTRWPLLPAAWEMRRPNWFRWSFFGKPVYAVGGVDWQGLPLANSRAGGRPRRVAYADHSVTHAEAPDTPTAIFTGTSISSAVASSIAAAVWHLRPDLQPAQVMRILTRSGDELDVRADFYTWKRPKLLAKLVKARHAKRLSLCPAVARACGRNGHRCPEVSVPVCPQWVSKAPELGPSIQGLLPGVEHPAKGPLPENPLKKFFDAASQRWVFPQPANDPCPGCTLVQKPPPDALTTTSEDPQMYQLVMAISSPWASANKGATIEAATLDIIRSVGGEVTDTMTYTFVPPTMGTGAIHTVPDLGDGQSLEGCSAQITFLVKKSDGTSVSVLNPVVVKP